MTWIPFDTDPSVNSLFPRHIATDAWVLYHGTSNLFEKEIDRVGLQPRRTLFDEPELRSVLALFKQLDWYGRTSASRNVLENWSLNYDLAHVEGKPLYLAEAASRAAIHASREFAGGEVVYALRYCFDDLLAYLDDINLRLVHRDSVQSEIDFLRQNNAHESSFPQLPSEDIEWLGSELRRLAGLRTRAMDLYEQFEYGVIYATRIKEEDLPNLTWSNSMGAKVFKTIPPNRLIAKTRVPAEYEPSPGIRIDAPSYRGVIARLMERE